LLQSKYRTRLIGKALLILFPVSFALCSCSATAESAHLFAYTPQKWACGSLTKEQGESIIPQLEAVISAAKTF